MAKRVKKTKAQKICPAQPDSLAYQGKVKFQILHGNKVISTKNYSNSGLPDLFKYISYALMGTFYSELRPCKVVLFDCKFTATGEKYEKPTSFIWETAYKNNELDEVSPYIVYDATPVTTSAADSCSTTFRFKIPFNWLYKKTFNVIGLFTENNSPCAYYLCTTEDSSGNKQWAVEELPDITGNYSIIVEWTMEVSNK